MTHTPIKRRQRTVDTTGLAPRFRPEQVARVERQRLTASIGERCLAKQLQRLERAGEETNE